MAAACDHELPGSWMLWIFHRSTRFAVLGLPAGIVVRFSRAAIRDDPTINDICGSRWRHGGARTQHDPRVDADTRGASTRRVRRTRIAHQHLLAYLHAVSDCFPVAFLPDVLLAYADLSPLRFPPPPPPPSPSFLFHRVTRHEFSYFSTSSSDAHVPLLPGRVNAPLREFAFQRVPRPRRASPEIRFSGLRTRLESLASFGRSEMLRRKEEGNLFGRIANRDSKDIRKACWSVLRKRTGEGRGKSLSTFASASFVERNLARGII